MARWQRGNRGMSATWQRRCNATTIPRGRGRGGVLQQQHMATQRWHSNKLAHSRAQQWPTQIPESMATWGPHNP
eukprot:5582764-Lingulodinium_polyedra.AAC.1